MAKKRKTPPREPTCCSCMHVEAPVFNVFRCRLKGKTVGAFDSCPLWDTHAVGVYGDSIKKGRGKVSSK
jgi:hypothetical protein